MPTKKSANAGKSFDRNVKKDANQTMSEYNRMNDQTLTSRKASGSKTDLEFIQDPKIQTFGARRVSFDIDSNKMIWFNNLDLTEELIVKMRPEPEWLLDSSELYLMVKFRLLTIDENTQEKKMLEPERYITKREQEVKIDDIEQEPAVAAEGGARSVPPVYKKVQKTVLRDNEYLDGAG
jgi:hypothetical protein